MNRKKLARIEVKVTNEMKEIVGDICYKEEVTFGEYFRYLITMDIERRRQQETLTSLQK